MSVTYKLTYLLLYYIYIPPYSCDTRSKAFYIYYCSHKGTGASSTSVKTAWSDQRDRLRESPKKGERYIRYRHFRRTMRLALISNRQPGSLMYPVYSTDTQLPLIRYLYSPHGPNGPHRQVKREILRIEFQKFSGPRPGIEPGTSGSTTQRFSTLSYHTAIHVLSLRHTWTVQYMVYTRGVWKVLQIILYLWNA